MAARKKTKKKAKSTRRLRADANDPTLLSRGVDLLDKATQDAILAEYARQFGATAFDFEHLEDLIDSPDGFGIAEMGGLSPLQRCICRVVEGIPLGDLDGHPDLAEALGLSVEETIEWEARRAQTGYSIPKEVFVIAAIRTFKSLLVAAAGIWASQHVDTTLLSGGEIPRYSIVSLTVDNAKVVLMHLLGALKKPKLAGLVVDEKDLRERSEWKQIIKESSSDLVGSQFLWHPSGVPIEIRVVAGKRAGGSTVSRWSAGVGLDEAPRMVGADRGVVNYTDIRRSVMGRLLPGAQLFSVGSPWASEGPVFDIFNEWWGQPRLDLVIFKAPGPLLNPVWWTQERCDELKEKDAVAYQMDVLAEFADAGEALYPQALIAKSTRYDQPVIDYQPGHEYSAAIDPATRNNAWTLVIADRVRYQTEVEGDDGIVRTRWRTKKRIVYHYQWQGSQVAPLSPRDTLQQVAEVLEHYHLDFCRTDQWSADAMRELAQSFGMALIIENWTSQENTNHYLWLRNAMANGDFEMPNDSDIAKDFRLVKRVIGTRGPAVHLSSTADGRHCDYVPAVVRATAPWIREDRDAPPEPGSKEALQAELDAARDKAYRRASRKAKGHLDPFKRDPLDVGMVDSLDELFGTKPTGGHDGW